MKRHVALIATLILTIAGGTGRLSGQTGGRDAARDEVAALRVAVQELRTEVSTLRGMLLSLRLERHGESISRVRSELETLQAERTRLADVDRARRQDLQDIEELLSRTDADARPGVESARTELAVTRGREITEQFEAMNVREGELLRRLHAEQQAARQVEEDARRSEKGPTR